MDKKDFDEIFDALQRINKCLDERFEKNAELYISPEQVEELKFLIYNGDYAQIVKKYSLKIFSPHVLANVLIKNAWLMKDENCAELQPIFENCDAKYLLDVMDGVFDNKIEMPSSFRLWLISIYLKKLNAAACQNILNQNLRFLNNPALKAICLAQILKNFPLEKRYKTFNAYVKQSENLLTQEKIFADLFSAEEFTDAIRNSVFDEYIEKDSPASRFWINRLSAGDIPFVLQKFKKYCRANSSDLKTCRGVLSRLSWISQKDFPTFAKNFAGACDCMDADFKAGLAESQLNRVSGQDEKILLEELAKYGIVDVKKKKLLTLDEIINSLNNSVLTDGNYRFLVSSFTKNYGRNYQDNLNKIKANVTNDKFKEFCCRLVELTSQKPQYNIRYIIYAIENFNSPDVHKRLLKHIEDKNIFNTCRNISGIDKVKTFVRQKDFELFKKLL